MSTSRLTAAAVAGAAAAVVMGIAAQAASADALGSPIQASAGENHQDATQPSVAWNPQTRRYLAVWRMELNPGQAITARFLDASGIPVGDAFRVSEPTRVHCNVETLAPCAETVSDPKVVYNATQNEFFVIWRREASFQLLPEAQELTGCSEIHGQRLSASGAEMGTNDVPISMREQSPCADDPDVSWSSVSNRYLVAWTSLGEGNVIRGRLVGADGSPAPGDELEISDEPSSGERPDIAHDAARDRWLVVWDDGSEIVRRLIDKDGAKVGSDATLSESGDVHDPSVVFNAIANEFLVAWDVSVVRDLALAKAAAAAVDPDRVVRAQRVNADGGEVGAGDFLVSDARFVEARVASVAWDPVGNRYAVVYEAIEGLDDVRRQRVVGQMLDGAGAPVGTPGFPVSSSALDSEEPRALVYNRETCEFLAGWEGRVDRDGENRDWEIHVRRLAATPCPVTTDGTKPAATPAAAAETPAGAPAVPVATRDTARPQIAVLGVRTFGGSCSATTALRVRVRLRDASRLERITVFVDGERVKRTTRKRFTVVISERGLKAGRHTMRIVARDVAGNRSTRTLRFRRCAQKVVLPRFTG